MKKYIKFVKEHYIQENWNEWNQIGKTIVYPAWLVRSGIMILIATFGFPLCYFHMKYVENEPIIEKFIDEKINKFIK